MVSISRRTPASFRIMSVASMISGPIPSPCATVMGVVFMTFYCGTERLGIDCGRRGKIFRILPRRSGRADGVDGLEAGGPQRRVGPEPDPEEEGHAEGQGDPAEVHRQATL